MMKPNNRMKLSDTRKKLEELAPEICLKCGNDFFFTDDVDYRVVCSQCGKAVYATWRFLDKDLL